MEDVNLWICYGMEETEGVEESVITMCPERSPLVFSLWREY